MLPSSGHEQELKISVSYTRARRASRSVTLKLTLMICTSSRWSSPQDTMLLYHAQGGEEQLIRTHALQHQADPVQRRRQEEEEQKRRTQTPQIRQCPALGGRTTLHTGHQFLRPLSCRSASPCFAVSALLATVIVTSCFPPFTAESLSARGLRLDETKIPAGKHLGEEQEVHVPDGEEGEAEEEQRAALLAVGGVVVPQHQAGQSDQRHHAQQEVEGSDVKKHREEDERRDDGQLHSSSPPPQPGHSDPASSRSSQSQQQAATWLRSPSLFTYSQQHNVSSSSRCFLPRFFMMGSLTA
ncbi:hypothetical protein F7725_029093 [Dissostichus mawsoni]|uniref:Uncharacterized protein n=1 Tax=Dissostichus mawsoni TaxID=36200 RepID=A0A7J5XHH6_DISMA|nr:hypothetical protein F7725_029093 [Dissostichus mawsoni]